MKNILSILLFLIFMISEKSFAGLPKCTGTYDEIITCIERFAKEKDGKKIEFIKREGDSLTLKDLSYEAEDKQIVDGKGDYGIKYNVTAFYPMHEISVINESAFEHRGTVIYQHKYGRFYGVPGEIKMSPSQSTFVSFNFDIEAGFSENGVAIYAINSGEIDLMSKFSPFMFGFIDAEYLNENEIKLTSKYLKAGELKLREGSCILEYKHSIWQFKTFGCSE